MSELSDKVYDLLKEIFPHSIIKKEHYVNFGGNKLFFDFYISDYDILFEIQGRQHGEFVKHFHQDRDGFLNLKRRDHLKIEYAETNRIPFIVIDYNEKINKDILLRRILKVQSEVLRNDRV